eukprot:scaffold1698_cov33-Tisochrysis_lutea.AAC.1
MRRGRRLREAHAMGTRHSAAWRAGGGGGTAGAGWCTGSQYCAAPAGSRWCGCGHVARRSRAGGTAAAAAASARRTVIGTMHSCMRMACMSPNSTGGTLLLEEVLPDKKGDEEVDAAEEVDLVAESEIGDGAVVEGALGLRG